MTIPARPPRSLAEAQAAVSELITGARLSPRGDEVDDEGRLDPEGGFYGSDTAAIFLTKIGYDPADVTAALTPHGPTVTTAALARITTTLAAHAAATAAAAAAAEQHTADTRDDAHAAAQDPAADQDGAADQDDEGGAGAEYPARDVDVERVAHDTDGDCW